SPPRSNRSSVYSPTGSTPRTRSDSRLAPRTRMSSGADTNAFLKRKGALRTRVRDRVHGGGRARDGGDARHAGGKRRLADPVAVGAGTRALRRVHDQVAAVLADQVDDGLVVVSRVSDLRHLVDLQPCCPQHACRAGGRDELEAETGESG